MLDAPHSIEERDSYKFPKGREGNYGVKKYSKQMPSKELRKARKQHLTPNEGRCWG